MTDRDVACPAPDYQGSNFESSACHLNYLNRPQNILPAEFNLYMDKARHFKTFPQAT